MENPFEHFAAKLDAIEALLVELKQTSLQDRSIKRYSVQELAENTPLSAQTIRAKISNGTINAERFGNKYLITAEEFKRVCEDPRSIKYRRN